MTVNELYEWIANPSTLTKASLPEFKQLIEEYPYFQAARMLYLKNLAIVEDVRFQKELKRMSVYVSDRMRLYRLTEGDKQENKFRSEDVLETVIESPNPIPELQNVKIINQHPVIPSADYINWLETNVEDIVSEDGKDNRLKHQDLIDSFIDGDKKLQFNKPENEDNKPENDRGDKIISSNDTFEKNALDDSYFTETLARVYFTQKRYEKALEIIRVLSLKYPEKNIYFADQIRYLEKIINIKK